MHYGQKSYSGFTKSFSVFLPGFRGRGAGLGGVATEQGGVGEVGQGGGGPRELGQGGGGDQQWRGAHHDLQRNINDGLMSISRVSYPELTIVYLSVPIFVNSLDHFVNFFVGYLQR